ncbi:putative fatty-acid--CoA ligase [Rhodococcus wratislaviensis NBRC 100605]|uniref:Putative fatty-acid--CoA ligase n=2 Tax=Rhodococcus wratislaviensis TaxID=44752 RepID=X0PR34_RHOWR|nr:putative fatty-acid--CoA ligase [Rhodococcus wratislaviensis NBRC 100605]
MTEVTTMNLPRSLTYPHVGVDAAVDAAGRAYGDRIALRDGAETLTFAELADRVRRVAGGLRERGIGTGDIVMIHLPNSIWHEVAYFGILAAGAAAAPVNPAQPPIALRQQMADLRVTAAVTGSSCGSRLADAGTEDLRLIVHIGPASPGLTPSHLVDFTELLAAQPIIEKLTTPDTLAHLQLTGGTTGRSKGVRVLHRNILAHAVQQAAWRAGHQVRIDNSEDLTLEPLASADDFPLHPGRDVQVSTAPMFHGLAMVSLVLNILCGTTTVLFGRFQASAYLAAVEEHRATYMTGAPAFYHALLAAPDLESYDLSSVRLAYGGGAPMDSNTLTRLRRALPCAVVAEGYGLSEATGSLASMRLTRPSENPKGTVGTPTPDTVLQIRSEDGRTLLEPGEIGEIWARGPQITDGYHGDPQLTAKQFDGGWLRTGDLGHLDDKGFLFLAGRAKDMIIYKGYNVYPQHLEEVLADHPDVAEVSVVGTAVEGVGETPVAFVVVRAGAEHRKTLLTELLAHVSERVAPYQRIHAVHVVDAMPLSATGKVLKAALRELLPQQINEIRS